MTRDEFVNLPLRIALGLIWDVASSRLRDIEAPRVPLPPKFDGRLRRSGGFVWYSELDLDSLEYWQKKNAASAEQGGQYADANQKAADALARWVEWRTLYPEQRWNGTRGNERVTALPPSRDPPLRQWDDSKKNDKPKGGTQRGPAPPPADEEEDSYGF